MTKHKIAYIDESSKDIREFQRQMFKTFDVLPFLPKTDLNEFVEELLISGAEAIVADFRLNEYRTDVKEPINYDGAGLIEKIWEIRKDFPCIVLTSYDDDAVQTIRDVNCVYPKEIILNPDKQPGKLSLAEKLRIQIEHYQAMLKQKTEKFHELLEKSEAQGLTEDEENELLKLDTFLESALDDREALPIEKKNQLAIGRIEELIDSTTELLNVLKERKK